MLINVPNKFFNFSFIFYLICKKSSVLRECKFCSGLKLISWQQLLNDRFNPLEKTLAQGKSISESRQQTTFT